MLQHLFKDCCQIHTMIDDRAIVSRVLNGDMQAFRLLIKQHERLVLHMIARVVKRDEEIEELCQDVFLKVYDKLADFEFNSKLSTWIATIAYRYAINHLRKTKMYLTELPDDERFHNRFLSEDNPQDMLLEADEDAFINKLIEQLPIQYRTVLTLYHLEQMTYPEICEVMKMPEGTVKNYLFRARNLLKEKIKKYQKKEELL